MRKKVSLCSCGARRNDAGKCPYGCDPFRGRVAREQAAERATRRRVAAAEKEHQSIGIGLRQVYAAADRLKQRLAAAK